MNKMAENVHPTISKYIHLNNRNDISDKFMLFRQYGGQREKRSSVLHHHEAAGATFDTTVWSFLLIFLVFAELTAASQDSTESFTVSCGAIKSAMFCNQFCIQDFRTFFQLKQQHDKN